MFFIRDQNHRNLLKEASKKFQDQKLAELVANNGLGYHHAGLSSSDRQLIENLFLNGNLPVLRKFKP